MRRTSFMCSPPRAPTAHLSRARSPELLCDAKAPCHSDSGTHPRSSLAALPRSTPSRRTRFSSEPHPPPSKSFSNSPRDVPTPLTTPIFSPSTRSHDTDVEISSLPEGVRPSQKPFSSPLRGGQNVFRPRSESSQEGADTPPPRFLPFQRGSPPLPFSAPRTHARTHVRKKKSHPCTLFGNRVLQ
jgi:hypothetical protein